MDNFFPMMSCNNDENYKKSKLKYINENER